MSAYICCFYWFISMIISHVIQIQKETLLNKYLTLALWVKTKKNLVPNLQKGPLQIWANTVSWEDRSSSQWPLPWAISFPSTFNSPQTGILSLCGANNTAPFWEFETKEISSNEKCLDALFFKSCEILQNLLSLSGVGRSSFKREPSNNLFVFRPLWKCFQFWQNSNTAWQIAEMLNLWGKLRWKNA